MHRSAHTDSFARDNLPPQDAWPDIDLSNFDYGPQLNAAVELTDEMVARGFGDHVALIGNAPPHLQGTHRLDKPAGTCACR